MPPSRAFRAGLAATALATAALVFSAQDTDRAAASQNAAARGWPAITQQAKPWTRWWWQGSAVTPASLTAQLETLKAAGLGGVEITPIYGVRGAEDRFIPYLSAAWMQVFDYTLREASRLDLGVDMATGTGWPFGGPWVGDDTAPRNVAHRTWVLGGGERLTEPVLLRQAALVRALGNQIHIVNEGAPGDPPRTGTAAQPVIRSDARAVQIPDLVEPVSANRNLQALALEQVKYPRDLPLIVLMAFEDGGRVLDLTARVGAGGVLDWTAPAGRWTLYALFAGWHGKLVERAAPGGEGNVIDHFSRDAIRAYLAPFDRAFAGRALTGLRAFFNDSYEVDDATGQADWTPSLLAEFQQRRGYDLRRHLPFLLVTERDDKTASAAQRDVSARVLADYRETISDLLLETFTVEWATWAHDRRRQVRNQAHGAPANLLDLYAATDIPETEGAEIQRFKWATSAAHVAGRRLVSAEAATWLGEHFRSTLADVRANVDRFFVAGVNHIFYHGTAYSPVGEAWPGWQFYAAVEFSPQNSWWDDFGALNRYVARVQSFLQAGAPDHDVLLYYPFYEALTVRGNARLTHFGGANPPPQGTAFEAAADRLEHDGFTYDFISDRQMSGARVESGRIHTSGGTAYHAVVLSSGRYIALDTFEHVLELARSGATVLSVGDWPADVAGLGNLGSRRARFRNAIARVQFGPADGDGIRAAEIGRGRILRGDDIGRLLARAGIRRERLVDRGLQFARRVDAAGRFYFLSNPGQAAIDGWVPLQNSAPLMHVLDPMSGRWGNARLRSTAEGREVYLQIPRGGSLIVRAAVSPATEDFQNYAVTETPVSIAGPWTVRFTKGGPTLPPERSIASLSSWTTFGEDAARFSGTASYTATFARPASGRGPWRLDLGQVRDSARVHLNGRELTTLIGPPYQIVLDDALVQAINVLAVSVSNLAANRIRDLDRRGVVWKKFYNVNFPARLPENRGPDGLFTAAGWDPLESGLLGPVTLTPLSAIR